MSTCFSRQKIIQNLQLLLETFRVWLIMALFQKLIFILFLTLFWSNFDEKYFNLLHIQDFHFSKQYSHYFMWLGFKLLLYQWSLFKSLDFDWGLDWLQMWQHFFILVGPFENEAYWFRERFWTFPYPWKRVLKLILLLNLQFNKCFQ